MLECLLRALQGSFGAPLNFEKLTFPKKGQKGPKSEKDAAFHSTPWF